MHARVCNGYGENQLEPFYRLASAILLQAARDASRHTNFGTQLDAILWLAGEDAAYLTDALDLPTPPLTLLTSGLLRKRMHR